jgi:hypothetical protein
MSEIVSPVIRWTIGDVSPAGFDTLQLSIHGAYRLFGPDATYVVCLNSVPLETARRATGEVPADVQWRTVTRDDIPPFIRAHLDNALAEGVGWKFAPLSIARDRPELSLDNDCILWSLPTALRRWQEAEAEHANAAMPVMAEDVTPGHGQFAALCGSEPRNSGIRALPRDFDLERRLRDVLSRMPVVMRSELDEHGLQAAAIALDPDHQPGHQPVVRVEEVSICSPFPPHLPTLGTCGAHFVGINARALPWTYEGRPAVDYIQAHWRRWKPEVARLVAKAPLAVPSQRDSGIQAHGAADGEPAGEGGDG